MAEVSLREYCDWRGGAARVDAGRGVIEGVKILGLESRNGRSYAADALRGATALYEGAKVNVNHPKGNPWEPRDYRDRLGVIRNVQWRPDQGLFGDLHFNPKHALAEQLSWDAHHAPENVGFSHNVQARTGRRGEKTVVEEIVRVQSVDLVADPATTRGLFESCEGESEKADSETLTSDEPLGEGGSGQLPGSEVRAADFELAALREELERLRQRDARVERERLIEQALSEHGLPRLGGEEERTRVILDERFVAGLYALESEEGVRATIAERGRLVRWLERESASRRPSSREQAAGGEEAGSRCRDRAEFLRAIRGPAGSDV